VNKTGESTRDEKFFREEGPSLKRVRKKEIAAVSGSGRRRRLAKKENGVQSLAQFGSLDSEDSGAGKVERRPEGSSYLQSPRRLYL